MKKLHILFIDNDKRSINRVIDSLELNPEIHITHKATSTTEIDVILKKINIEKVVISTKTLVQTKKREINIIHYIQEKYGDKHLFKIILNVQEYCDIKKLKKNIKSRS